MTKTKATKPSIPEELEDIWDEAIATAFKALRLEHQRFLLEYLSNGFNGAAAYRVAYESPNMDTQVAATAASRLLRNVHIRAILEKFKDEATEDFFLCVKVFRDAARATLSPAVDIPDHEIRIKGGQNLAKLRGFNAPEKVQDDRFTALLNHMNRQKEDTHAPQAPTRPARPAPGRGR